MYIPNYRNTGRFFFNYLKLWLSVRYLVLKYVCPSCIPLCLPRSGSSHSTPSHSPRKDNHAYCGTSNMVNIYIHVNKINTVFNNLTLCTLSLHCSRRWACLCFLVIQNTLIISIFQKFTILKNSTAVVLNNDQLY